MSRLKVLGAGVALFVLVVAPVWGRAKLMPLEERLAKSSVIGIVEVIATVPWSSATLSAPRSHTGFLQVAIGRVIKTLKGGVRPGEAIEIDFDNGFTCPDVLYEPGHTYLVFLEPAGQDRFATVNYEAGRYKLENGIVSGRAVGLAERLKLEFVLDKLAALINGEG